MAGAKPRCPGSATGSPGTGRSEAAHGHRAVVLTAFAVESFCQALGPDLFPDRWASGTEHFCDKAVFRKLELIGHEVGVDVSYDQYPWMHLSALLEDKDQLLTPNSSPVPLNEDVSVDEDADLKSDVRGAVQRHFRPLHNLIQLEKVAAEVNEGVLNIWDAAGGGSARCVGRRVLGYTIVQLTRRHQRVSPGKLGAWRVALEDRSI